MDIVKSVLATEDTLPPITAMGYEYVVAANGLFVRAEDSRIEAVIPVSHTLNGNLPGLKVVQPRVCLKVPRIGVSWLNAIHDSATKHLPFEVMYQFSYDAKLDNWNCKKPTQTHDTTSVDYVDDADAIVDLHSHNTMDAFFSETDNRDEKGFRFYCVIGNLHLKHPTIKCRIGVYGNYCDVQATAIFVGFKYGYHEFIDGNMQDRISLVEIDND